MDPNADFLDHFSGHADEYARARPTYPDALFGWIADAAAQREVAHDCATGNGQAARSLARHFSLVIASDASVAQLGQAREADNLYFVCAHAQAAPLARASVDVCTVAQAAHWFDLPAFYREATRTIRPGGLLVLWCYERFAVEPSIDGIIDRLYGPMLHDYWPPQRIHIERGYRDFTLPGTEITTPAFEMRVAWNVDATLAYLATWSAVQRYRAATRCDPIEAIAPELRACWGDTTREVVWPLRVRAARIGG